MSKTNLRVWSRDEIAQGILRGETLVIYDSLVLRITQNWLESHPGGALSILHFVGRDATDEINAYHAEPTLKRVRGFAVGRVELDEKVGWDSLVPPVASGWIRKDGAWFKEASALRMDDTEPRLASPEYREHVQSEILLVSKDSGQASPPSKLESKKQTDCPTVATITPPPAVLSPTAQQQHAKAYRELHAKITAAGLYQTPYISGYGPEFVRYAALAGSSYWAYQHGWFTASAVALGLLWHQLSFIAHDLGHMGVSHNWTIDRLVGIFIADFIGGLSIGWWVDNHNIHHLVTNHPSHDPDIQHIPFFAISPAFLSSLYSSYYHRVMAIDWFARLLLPFQHKLYYFVMSLARFNLYANSYQFLAMRARRDWSWHLEITGIVAFWTWYGFVLYGIGSWKYALAYLMASHIVASPLHIQIVLSHFSRSTDDLGVAESFVHRQLRTTTDVICSDNVAFIHGGLHLQVTHHLFPRLPRHNLRAASKLVKEFAQERGLEYAEFGFFKGNGDVLGVLKEVADQARIVGMVAREEVKHIVEAQQQSVTGAHRTS